MTSAAAPASPAAPPVRAAPSGARARIIAAVLLVLLCAIAFRDTVRAMIETAVATPEQAHALGAIVLAMIVVVRRRRELAMAAGGGSSWGAVIVALALVMFVFASWPFNYAIPRRLAVVPALAGCVLVAGGWRFLRLCIAPLLLVTLSVPVGARFYSAIIVKPEEITIPAVRSALELVPGVVVDLDGLDLLFERGGEAGVIALGHSYRGASLMLASAVIVVFVTALRRRPWWQGIAMTVLAGPIIAAGNFLRLFTWGLVTLATDAPPTTLAPRVAGTVASIGFAWLASSAALWLLGRLAGADSSVPAAPHSRAKAINAAVIVTGILLAAAAAALQPGVDLLIRATEKQPIEPRRTIRAFDGSGLTSFVPATNVELVGASPNDDLGTDEWVTAPVRQIRGAQAGRSYLVLLTYYSDPRETIPHTPEVCYRQGGARVRLDTTVTVPTPALAPEVESIEARLLEVTMGRGRDFVMYVLCAEGTLCPGRESARWRIGLPGAKRTYFSKVEVSAHIDSDDREAIIEGCGLLLQEALAEMYQDYWPTAAQVAGE